MFKRKKPLLTLEDKIDEILRYQKSEHRWGILKALTNVTFFVFFIILPIIGVVYFFDWARDSLGINLDQAKQVVEGLKTIGGSGDGFTDSVDSLIQGLGQDQGTSESLKKLGLEDLNVGKTVKDLGTQQEGLMNFLDEVNTQ